MKLRLKSLALTLLLAAASVPAWALGLGQIQVKSRINEPLLADIPVVTSDPSELTELQARLAAPETFVRIGLPLPDRLVSDLHFNVIDGDDGRVYIRVTSTAPVTQPLVNFLVEVDWGRGKLVREYSALVATPNTMTAVAQPVIEAPVVAAPVNTIDRSTAPPDAPASTLSGSPPTVSSIPTVAAPPATPAPSTPSPSPAVPAAAPAPTPTVATANAPEPSPSVTPSSGLTRPLPQASGQTYGPVKTGQTLGQIIGAMQAAGQSPDEVMQSLVALNPDAFIGGDRNRLLAGSVLRMPEGTTPPEATRAAARSVARASVAATRTSRSAARPTGDVASTTPAANSSRPSQPASTPAAAEPKRNAEARLRIMPGATPDAAASGSKSGRGTSGGDGDMLQQLQTSQETIATRDAEIKELKSRVTELEQLQQKQAQLIAMKNSELASAQQKLAARASQPANAPNAAPGGFGPLVWLLPAGLGVALLLGIWQLLRRRKAVAADENPRPRKGSASKEPTVPVAGGAPAQSARVEPSFAATPVEVPQQPLAGEVREDGMPTWVRGDAWMPQDPAAALVEPTVAAPAATVTIEPADSFDMPPTVEHAASDVLEGPLNSHVRLAQTYIDLGDTDTARTILQGVLDSGDVTARAQATAVLRNLH